MGKSDERVAVVKRIGLDMSTSAGIYFGRICILRSFVYPKQRFDSLIFAPLLKKGNFPWGRRTTVHT